MKKLLYGFLISLMLVSNAFSAMEWRAGSGSNELLGTSDAADIDTNSYQNIVAPLDRLNSIYRRGTQIIYASASTITVGIGEVTCSNADGSIRKFRANTSATTVSWANIDTGAEAGSTTYYIYSAAESDADTFTCVISTNSSTPTGITYYRRLGSFYNDSSSNITNITNDDAINPAYYDSGWFAVSAGASYTKTHSLGTQNLMIKVYFSTDSSGSAMSELQSYIATGLGGAGGYVTAITPTQLTVNSGNVYVDNYCSTYFGGSPGSHSSGYYKVLAIALE